MGRNGDTLVNKQSNRTPRHLNIDTIDKEPQFRLELLNTISAYYGPYNMNRRYCASTDIAAEQN